MTDLASTVFLSTANVAAYLNVSEEVLRAWRFKKTGPTYIKAVGKVLYRESDIIAFLNANIVVAEWLQRQRGGSPPGGQRKNKKR